MTQDNQNPWAALTNAPIFERGTYFSPNSNFALELTKVIYKQAQSADRYTIFEFKILESNNPAHPPGSSGTWMQKMGAPGDNDSRQSKIAGSAINDLLAALLGPSVAKQTANTPTPISPDNKQAVLGVIAPHLPQLMLAATTGDRFKGLTVRLQTGQKTKQQAAIVNGQAQVQEKHYTTFQWLAWERPEGWVPSPAPAGAAPAPLAPNAVPGTALPGFGAAELGFLK